MTDPMSGGDAASRGHLNADGGVDGRDRTGPDIDALAPEHPASPGDMSVQRNRVAPSPIGGSTEADAAEVGGSVVCWRCRMCGKWSHAKRGPIAHHRWVNTVDDDGEAVGRHTIWCGPFDRWEAVKNDPKPRPDYPHMGTPSGKSYAFVEDVDYGGIPW